jgi:CysZ protein
VRLGRGSESVLYGLNCAFRGLKLVFTHGLRKFVVVPVLLNLILFSTAFWLSGYYFAEFLEWLIPGWLDWLRWFLWPLFGISLLLFALFSFTLVANLLGSPFYGSLAKRVETQILGDRQHDQTDLGGSGWMAGLYSESKRLGYFISRAIPLLILFLIPGVNLIAPFLWLWFSAWFLGMEYLAYPLEESGLTFPDQRRIMRPYRLSVTTFGGVTLLGLAVPVLNLVVPPAAVIGATLFLHDKKPNPRHVRDFASRES